MPFPINFSYKKGPTFIDGWRVIDQFGDCGSYALTVAKNHSGSWSKLITDVVLMRKMFWLVNSPSNGAIPRHVVLHVRGEGWADSSLPGEFTDNSDNTKVLPLLFPWVFLRVLMGKGYGLFVKE